MYKAILFDLDGTLTESGRGYHEIRAVRAGEDWETGERPGEA